ncbi:MAG TPA: hypothetical protein VGI66_13555 [Streptosporangiaceae bacterium]
MCKESATADDIRAAMPHSVVGSAADPIALEPVDDVIVTTLVDNVYDALLTGDNTITRAPLAAGTAQAPQFQPGFTNVGLMAEHGFSALVTVRRGDTTTSVLFDTGLSPQSPELAAAIAAWTSLTSRPTQYQPRRAAEVPPLLVSSPVLDGPLPGQFGDPCVVLL